MDQCLDTFGVEADGEGRRLLVRAPAAWGLAVEGARALLAQLAAGQEAVGFDGGQRQAQAAPAPGVTLRPQLALQTCPARK